MNQNTLIFLDLETTGLQPESCHILEVAAVAVRLPTFEPIAEISRTVVPPLWPTVERNLHDRVAAMHGMSGLLAMVDAAYKRGGAARAQDVESEVLSFVREHAPQTLNWHTPLAGANPDFDRRFLVKHMPKLARAFHYRNFDVRSITQLQDWIEGLAHVESPHRALDDCYAAIDRVRAFLGIEYP